MALGPDRRGRGLRLARPGQPLLRRRAPRNAVMYGPPGRALRVLQLRHALVRQRRDRAPGVGAGGAAAGGRAARRDRRPARAARPRDLCRGPARLARSLGLDGGGNGAVLGSRGAPARSARVVVLDDGSPRRRPRRSGPGSGSPRRRASVAVVGARFAVCVGVPGRSADAVAGRRGYLTPSSPGGMLIVRPCGGWCTRASARMHPVGIALVPRASGSRPVRSRPPGSVPASLTLRLHLENGTEGSKVSAGDRAPPTWWSDRSSSRI